VPTMLKSHLISHSLPVPVSCSLQVSLLASQPTESAAGGKPCGEPAISHDSHHVSLVQWTNLFASRPKGPRFKSPGGYLCETWILLLALSRFNTNSTGSFISRSQELYLDCPTLSTGTFADLGYTACWFWPDCYFLRGPLEVLEIE
jgi:hypothetical protein